MSQAFLKQLASSQNSLAVGGELAQPERSDVYPVGRGKVSPRSVASRKSAVGSAGQPRDSRDGHASGLFDRWHLLSPGEPMVLGRDPRCAIVIDAEQYPVVSREHAVVRALPAMATNLTEQLEPPGSDGGQGSTLLVEQVGLSPAGFERTGRGQKSGAIAGPMRWQLCDLGSANGTYVNGQRLWGCQLLEVGDRLQLGQSGPTFSFEYQVSSTPASPDSAGSESGQPVTISQLFPLISTGSDLTQKAYLIPGIVTVAVVVSLFLTVGQPQWFNGLLASYLSFGAYYFVYRLCGKAKPWWLPLLTAGLTVALLSTPLLNLSMWLFRDILPGAIPTVDEQLPIPLLFTRMLVGAGLMEELLKVLPLAILAGLARYLEHPWRDRLGIWEPLDGILLGAASAVGFTLLETLGQYVPYMTQMSLGSDVDAGQLAGLQLLIPRLLGSVAGHIAYSGYFGYFIGLSVMVPQRRWLILGVGYGTASLLHALWNVMGSYSAFLLAAVGILSYACLVAAILKARSLSPHRAKNFATQFSEHRN